MTRNANRAAARNATRAARRKTNIITITIYDIQHEDGTESWTIADSSADFDDFSTDSYQEAKDEADSWVDLHESEGREAHVVKGY